MALLSHACLITRGARLFDCDTSTAVLPDNWALNDPIRINYKLPSSTDHGPGSAEQTVATTLPHVFLWNFRFFV